LRCRDETKSCYHFPLRVPPNAKPSQRQRRWSRQVYRFAKQAAALVAEGNLRRSEAEL
jgi:hypothetical protein